MRMVDDQQTDAFAERMAELKALPNPTAEQREEHYELAEMTAGWCHWRSSRLHRLWKRLVALERGDAPEGVDAARGDVR